jgi:CRP-like cAMP-binding protein
VVREGAAAHALHVIVDGSAEVTIGGETVGRLGPGDSFGEIALFDDGPRTATVTADGPLRVLAIDGHTFRETIGKDPELGYRLIVHLAKLVRSLDVHVADCRSAGSFH